MKNKQQSDSKEMDYSQVQLHLCTAIREGGGHPSLYTPTPLKKEGKDGETGQKGKGMKKRFTKVAKRDV